MRVSVLGPLAVDDDGSPVVVRGTRQRHLLAVLALSPRIAVRPLALIDEVWADELPVGPTSALQTAIHKLRTDVGRRWVETVEAGYMLCVEPDDVDALGFERLVGAGRAALATGEPQRAEQQFAAALALWRGDPLLELPDSPAIVAARSRSG